MSATKHRAMKRLPFATLTTMLMGIVLLGCEPDAQSTQKQDPAGSRTQDRTLEFQVVGALESDRLDEASGMQAGIGGVFYVLNDEGKRLYVIDATGRNLGSLKISGAKSRDWEDITRVPGPEGPLLVIGDIGDNHAARSRPSLYFVAEPGPDRIQGELGVRHRLRYRYPDGPRDVEALAYDAVNERLLLMSKRDQPPRLYGIPLDLALWNHEAEAEFLGEVPGFRPPTRADILRHPGRGLSVSQPTGMDISPDGRLAAVLTYRSLYLFRREREENWVETLQRQPLEIIGPPGTHDEAVAFSTDGRSVYVTTERRPAPLYRLDLPADVLKK